MKKLILSAFLLFICYSIIYSQEYPFTDLKITNENFTENRGNSSTKSNLDYSFPSIFLKGNFVEVGIHPAGSFGCDNLTPIPDNYHKTWTFWSNPSIEDQLVGFNCDVQLDGYETGTPGFMGDYFVPGAPLEGWGIEWENQGVTRNFKNFGAIADYGGSSYFGIQPTNFEDLSNENELIAEWTGEATSGNEKIQVKQTVRLGYDNTYFTIEVTMKNIGSVTLTGVEYYRNVDPDNDVRPSGTYSYNTINYVKSQPGTGDNLDTAIVYAIGPIYGYPLILGTIDSRAKVTAEGVVNSNQYLFDPDLILDSPLAPTQANPVNSDIQIALAYELGTLQPGQCVSFIYYYNMVNIPNQQIVFPITAQIGKNVSCTGNVDFYDASFGIGANSIFSWQWDFDSNGIYDAEGRNVSHQFTEPGIYPVTLKVEMCDGTIHQVTENVNIETTLLIDLGYDIIKCEGDIVTIDAGEGYFSYLWNNQEISQSIEVTEPGIYTVTVSNLTGCTNSDSLEVINFETPYLNISQDTTIYEGLSLCISALDYLSVKMNDGSDGIEFTDASNYNFTDEFSIISTFTINSSEAFENYGGIVAKGGGNEPNELDYSLFLWNDGHLKFMLQDEFYSQLVLTSNQLLNFGEDYQVAVVVSSNSVSLYINGVLDNSVNESRLVKNSLGELNIGRQLSDGYNDFVNCMSLYGVVSQVRMWTRVLSEIEISNSFDSVYNKAERTNLIFDLNFSNEFGNQIFENVSGEFGNLVGLSNWSSQIPFEESLMNGQTFLWLPSNETSSAITIMPNQTTTYTCITNNDYCENTQEVTVTVEPIQSTSLGGRVIYSGGGIAGCKVKRYKLGANGQYHYEEPMVYTDVNGYYNFPSTDPGIYILQAIGPNTYTNVYMTYYDSVHTWQLATPIPVLSGQNLDIVIVMRERLKKAAALISGKTYYNTDIKEVGILKGKGYSPAGEIEILLNELSQNPFNPEDFRTEYKYFDGTISDESGYYQFTEANFSKYINYPTLIENPNILTEYYEFTVDQNNLIFEDFDFLLVPSGISTSIAENLKSDGIYVYPNPVIGNKCNVLYNSVNDIEVEIEVYNSVGQLVSESKQLSVTTGKNNFEVKIPEKSGVYFIKLLSDNEIKTLKVLKN